jgi:hypothetical protein
MFGDWPFAPGAPLLRCHVPFRQPKIFPEASDKTTFALPGDGFVHTPEGSVVTEGGINAVEPLRSNLPVIMRSPLIDVCPHAETAMRNSASFFMLKIL